jgi:hypothetical protein
LFLVDASSQSKSYGGYDIGVGRVAGMRSIDLVFGSEIDPL